MTDVPVAGGLTKKSILRNAVCRSRPLSRDGLSERLFAAAFSGLVYPQIWEDPDVDMDAMALGAGHRVVAIASGGCNVLAYLTRDPGRIDAVDLNSAHIALNRLKHAALVHLPGHADFVRFFARAGETHNAAAYDRFLAPHLDRQTRAYWERRTWTGKRRIAAFNVNVYRTGLLGRFITAAHALARLHGIDPSGLTRARSLREQRRFFEEELAPLFDRPLVRALLRRRASLFGLGIPPAQYGELAGDGTIADVLRARLEKLACGFPLKDNYFAWQAFARQYPDLGEARLPAYLEPANHAALAERVGRVHLHHTSIDACLAAKPDASVDRYVLLDAQDWMNDAALNALWREIDRTAASGARVVFRTAAGRSILEGRVSPTILDRWTYRRDASRDYARKDRSAVYGGFHLYEKAL